MVQPSGASFRDLLRDYRLAAGLTQEGLAERAGISARSVRALEQGAGKPQGETARRLATALELAGEELVQFLLAARPAPRHRATLSAQRPAAPPLPLAPTRLLGRTRELAAVLALLAQEHGRLLTLTGPGGVGKTRLALAAALRLQEQFPDGVVFVPLAALDDPELVVSTIMRALGVADDPGQTTLDALSGALREQRCLLVLDNFEQVVEAGSQVAALRAACPGLRLLVTSRVMLRVQGEQVYPVPPLAFAEPRHLPPLDVLAQLPAIALFVERARSVKPDFTLTPANAEPVARICAHLDGLPLALELAATRVGILPAPALLRRLEGGQGSSSLQLLTGGARDLPERQRTVRNTIAWSYELLSHAQRVLFRRLGVFRGGWSLQAAEALGAGIDELDPLDGLSALAEQSLLVIKEVGGEPRFDMLETIREYALEQLEASGEAKAIRQRHTLFVLEFAETAEPELTGARQGIWMAALEAEHDNLRAALRWSIEHTPETALRLSAALSHFWYGHTHLDEGRAWLEAAIKQVDATGVSRTGLVAKALHGVAVLALFQNDFDAVRHFLNRARALQQEHGDTEQLALVLHDLGRLAQNEADYAQAEKLYRESLTLFQGSQNRWGIGVNLYNLGAVTIAQGDVTQGGRLLHESLAIFRDLGDKGSEAGVMVSLGGLARDLGDYRRAAEYAQAGLKLYQEVGNKHGGLWAFSVLFYIAQTEGDSGQARSYYEEAVALSRESGTKHTIVAERGHLARLARDAGDYERAMGFARERLELVRDTGSKGTIIDCLEELAAAAAVLGNTVYAACLWGAVEHLRQVIGHPRVAVANLTIYERSVARARGCVDEAVWAAAWARGRTMSLEQTIDYALNESSASSENGSN